MEGVEGTMWGEVGRRGVAKQKGFESTWITRSISKIDQLAFVKSCSKDQSQATQATTTAKPHFAVREAS